MSVYVHYQWLVAIWQVLVQIYGNVLVHHWNLLGCAEAGYGWTYTSIWGSVFTLLNMMSIGMQSMMIMKVFYSVPRKAGFFATETPKDDDGFKSIN